MDRATDTVSLSLSRKPEKPWLSAQDIRRKKNAHIQQIIREIKSIHGNEYFMRGLPYGVLAKCATHNPVLVLVAVQNDCHALIALPNKPIPITLKLKDITSEKLASISVPISAIQNMCWLI
jgi:hypothetical protein